MNSQTSIIAAALLVAYIIFVTVNNELSCWLEILGISSGGCCAGVNASGPGATGIKYTTGGGGTTVGVGGVRVGPGGVQLPPIVVSGPGGTVGVTLPPIGG